MKKLFLYKVFGIILLITGYLGLYDIIFYFSTLLSLTLILWLCSSIDLFFTSVYFKIMIIGIFINLSCLFCISHNHYYGFNSPAVTQLILKIQHTDSSKLVGVSPI